MKKKTSHIPVKLEVDGDCIVSEVLGLTSTGFRCILERTIPLQSKVHITIILPRGSQKKTSDQKIDAEGLVTAMEYLPNEKNVIHYQTDISFLDLAASEKRWISQLLENY